MQLQIINKDLNHEIIQGYKKNNKCKEIYNMLQNELPISVELNYSNKHYKYYNELLDG